MIQEPPSVTCRSLETAWKWLGTHNLDETTPFNKDLHERIDSDHLSVT